jgi:hypothetical protein
VTANVVCCAVGVRLQNYRVGHVGRRGAGAKQERKVKEMAYAYLSKSGTLHIVDSRAYAEEFSENGKIVETNVDHRGGYMIGPAGQNLIAEDGVVHVDDAKAPARSLTDYPELKYLYDAVK